MKRYYYTCPIVAAYMTQYFAMKIHGNVWHQDDYTESRRPLPLWALARKIEQFSKEECSERFYIHSNSLHMLRPIIGDTVEAPHGEELRIKEVVSQEYAEKLSKSCYCIVIQRHRLPFFWPQSEAL